MACEGSSSAVNTVPNEGPSRRSTQAPKIRPVATEMNLSHGSAWMPRVVPAFSLNEMLFCTGAKSGSPASSILARCQFSLNQPRLSPCTGRSKSSTPGIDVGVAARGLENSIGYWPCSWYFASVAAFCGRHQAWLSRYQAMVSSMPASKLENCGAQPSSVRSLVESIA